MNDNTGGTTMRRFIEDLFDRVRDSRRRVKIAKIVRVFSREVRLVCDVFVEDCESPGKCAIGALLVAAGEPEDSLVAKWSVSTLQQELLTAAYGLVPAEVSNLMSVNDAVHERYEDDSFVLRYSKLGTCAVATVDEARVCDTTAFVRGGLVTA